MTHSTPSTAPATSAEAADPIERAARLEDGARKHQPGGTPPRAQGAQGAHDDHATATLADRNGNGTLPGTDADNRQPPQPREARPTGWFERLCQRLEAGISRLSTRNNFWHRICSWVWLPLAYRSGIKFSRGDESTFSAILPFRKFNKNWYNAMAGGALLGNAEVAGGMYVFKKCGADYTVVCKHLEYTFRRPCHGPAVYRVEPREDIAEMVATRDEFNITVDMHIVQMVHKPEDKERRVGHCTATYHVTPKSEVRRRHQDRKARSRA